MALITIFIIKKQSYYFFSLQRIKKYIAINWSSHAIIEEDENLNRSIYSK